MGLGGFGAGYLADLRSPQRPSWLTPSLWTVSLVLIPLSVGLLAAHPARFGAPAWLSLAGWGLAAPLSVLLARSLFVDLPVTQAYGPPRGARRLVASGSYALVRHPSALWFLLLMGALVAATRSLPLAAVTPAWASLEVLWVRLQERRLVVEAPEYVRYRQQTPFLVPTRRSIAAFRGARASRAASEPGGLPCP